jgi:hypothetical protein
MKGKKNIFTKVIKRSAIFSIIIAIISVLAIAPIRKNTTMFTFKTALAHNKAMSAVNLNIYPMYQGTKIEPEYVDIIPLDKNSRSLGKKYSLQTYSNSITKIVPARWVKVDFEGFDKNGTPKYFYHMSPVRFAVVVIDTQRQIAGSAVVSVIPNKPMINKAIRIEMCRIRMDKSDSNHITMDGGGGYSILEQYKNDIQGNTKIAYLHSVYNERTNMIFQPNSIVYIQSKARFDTTEPLTTQWQDNGAVATPALNYAGTGFNTGYIENGTSMMAVGDVRYVYERYKYVVNGYVYYWEHVYPERMYGSTLESLGSPNLSTMSGKSTSVGSQPGASNQFPLSGEPQYYFTPAVVISFGASYGESGGTVGISIALSVQRHYAQKVLVNVIITGSNGGKTLYGFDANTNWGETYFIWVN